MIAATRAACRVHVTGVVQGVGFRPFVHRLATKHALHGWVRNQSGNVEIAIEGEAAALEAFLVDLRVDAPPLARIDDVSSTWTRPGGTHGFAILESTMQADRRQPLPPDVSMCDACARELFDPRNRRYRYPFITCTDCGPRYSVIERLPYDRERTSMRAFPQCADCRREYETPGDRRFHSETNSCPRCGPRLRFHVPGAANGAGGRDPLAATADALLAGRIVAVRGVGGFHLAVDATNDAAVRRLRERKHREQKPLAVMVATMEDVRAMAEVSEAEAALLTRRERPIVLLPARPSTLVAPSVAPGLDSVGVMLAYSPLHRLLLDAVRRPLVMTSGNLSEEPIAAQIDEALPRLAGIADAFLLHDREIVARIDDSVMRVMATGPAFLRRARGFAPLPVPLPVASPTPLAAVGPHLKNTFTLVHGASAFVSQHIGDLDTLETLEHFRATLAAQQRLFRITPQVVARDLHPGYLSTQVAAELGLPVIPVQHHHAHVAAVLAEHAVVDRAIGIAYDGTGYGDDGHVWGAEILLADLTSYERVAQLRYAPLPGGELAIRSPWRVALGYLSLAPELAADFSLAFADVAGTERAIAERQITQSLNAPLASSIGRLFDAAAAVLGVRRRAFFEGQAAMELEALAGTVSAEAIAIPVRTPVLGAHAVLDPVPMLAELGRRARRGEDVRVLAATLHESIAQATATMACRACEAHGIATVALGGGVFQNARLTAALGRRLEASRLRVLLPRALPANDGGISYGQAAIAATRLATGMFPHPSERVSCA